MDTFKYMILLMFLTATRNCISSLGLIAGLFGGGRRPRHRKCHQKRPRGTSYPKFDLYYAVPWCCPKDASHQGLGLATAETLLATADEVIQ